MIDLIRKQIASKESLEDKVFLTREYLQLLALKFFYESRYFQHIAFVGGTALRLVYDLKRFSEDLNFSLVVPKGYVFSHMVEKLRKNFIDSGFEVEVEEKQAQAVGMAMIRFGNLLYPLGLSPLKDQKLSIKIEVDMNPPSGWGTELALINRTFIFTVMHFDIASLFATKLHACFYRTYTKGRDFYDLLWYLGKKITPNWSLLNNAIQQTHHENLNIDPHNFSSFLTDRIEKIDFAVVRKDVGRFLEDKKELDLLHKELFLSIVRKQSLDAK